MSERPGAQNISIGVDRQSEAGRLDIIEFHDGVPYVRLHHYAALQAQVEQGARLREAAQELYDDFARINPPDLLPLPIQKIGRALSEQSEGEQ